MNGPLPKRGVTTKRGVPPPRTARRWERPYSAHCPITPAPASAVGAHAWAQFEQRGLGAARYVEPGTSRARHCPSGPRAPSAAAYLDAAAGRRVGRKWFGRQTRSLGTNGSPSDQQLAGDGLASANRPPRATRGATASWRRCRDPITLSGDPIAAVEPGTRESAPIQLTPADTYADRSHRLCTVRSCAGERDGRAG